MAKKMTMPKEGDLYRTKDNTGINLQLRYDGFAEIDGKVIMRLSGSYFTFEAPMEKFNHYWEKTVK